MTKKAKGVGMSKTRHFAFEFVFDNSPFPQGIKMSYYDSATAQDSKNELCIYPTPESGPMMEAEVSSGGLGGYNSIKFYGKDKSKTESTLEITEHHGTTWSAELGAFVTTMVSLLRMLKAPGGWNLLRAKVEWERRETHGDATLMVDKVLASGAMGEVAIADIQRWESKVTRPDKMLEVNSENQMTILAKTIGNDPFQALTTEEMVMEELEGEAIPLLVMSGLPNVIWLLGMIKVSGPVQSKLGEPMYKGGLVLEGLSGTLDKVKSALDAKAFFQIFYGLLAGLEGIHYRGWSHSDIKPHNAGYYVATDGDRHEYMPKWIDFGMAMRGQMQPVGQAESGTSEYYSPTHAQRFKTALSCRSDGDPGSAARCAPWDVFADDIFALGLTFLDVAAGGEPMGIGRLFQGDERFLHRGEFSIGKLHGFEFSVARVSPEDCPLYELRNDIVELARKELEKTTLPKSLQSMVLQMLNGDEEMRPRAASLRRVAENLHEACLDQGC